VEKNLLLFNKSYFYKSSACLSIFFTLLIQSCNSPGTDPVNPYDYFPVEIGRYQIYQVDEAVYSAGQKIPVLKTWQEKNEIVRVNKDSSGKQIFIVSISIRKNASEYWIKNKEYSVSATPDKIVINLDNQLLTPLVFPYDLRVKWDGYQYFNLDDDDPRYGSLHHYEKINEPLTIDSIKFKNTLKVSERNDTTSQAQYNLGFKYYASGIGLVADEQTDFEYLQENGNFVGYRTIGSGTKRIRKILEYGNR